MSVNSFGYVYFGGVIRNIIILVLFLSTSFGAIIHVTGDDYSIQDAIDNAGDVDTIVVHQGVYEENLIIDKSITLTSLALFDPTTNTIAETLDDWVDLDQYIVTNEDINFTIIDGSGKLQSTITIATEEDICIEPIILGFTIQDGAGTLVERYYDNPDGGIDALEQYVGGGVLSYLANPTLHYNKIQNNGIEAQYVCSNNVFTTQTECEGSGYAWIIVSTKTGSGIYSGGDDDIGFLDRTKTLDRDCGNDTYDFTYNFFENNYSSLGRHIGNRYFQGNFDLSNCVFDFWNCQDEGVYQTPIWVNIDDIDNLVAEDEENSDSGCLYFGGNVYVDPVSGNDDLNDGLSWEVAFYTINHAIASVVGTEQNPINIYLAEGVYSPSTNGEIFPIDMISYVNLIGQGEEVTILDAEQTGNVIIMENCDNNTISGLSITGGAAENSNNKGGGMYLYNSNPYITNINITLNTAESWGGGMFLEISSPTMAHINISDNSGLWGGGMFLYESSNPTMTYMKISNNSAREGGGMGCMFSSSPILKHVVISDNIAITYGGGLYSIAYSNPTLDYVTINGNSAFYLGGGIGLIDNCSAKISNSTITNNLVDPDGWCVGAICCYIGSEPSKLTNVIMWNNTPESITSLLHPPPIVNYSNIQNGWEDGIGNINIDPLFMEPENGDFSLQENSPCIDYGTDFYYWEGGFYYDWYFFEGDTLVDMTSDEYCGTAPDMGAYEYITEDCVECPDSIEGDTNFDGSVNILDIVIVANCILSDSCDICFDLNADGDLNILDIVLIVNIILNP